MTSFLVKKKRFRSVLQSSVEWQFKLEKNREMRVLYIYYSACLQKFE